MSSSGLPWEPGSSRVCVWSCMWLGALTAAVWFGLTRCIRICAKHKHLFKMRWQRAFNSRFGLLLEFRLPFRVSLQAAAKSCCFGALSCSPLGVWAWFLPRENNWKDEGGWGAWKQQAGLSFPFTGEKEALSALPSCKYRNALVRELEIRRCRDRVKSASDTEKCVRKEKQVSSREAS